MGTCGPLTCSKSVDMPSLTQLLTAAALVATAGAQATQQHVLGERDYVSRFEEWTKQHKKHYRAGERDYRFKNFRQAHDIINKHNADPSHKFKLGHNQFSDMGHDEFKSTMLGLTKNPLYGGQRANGNNKNEHHDSLSDSEELPDTVDWRQRGAVTAVKNQGQCGSCWSFSATGSIEGANQISTGRLVELSEQQLIDCSSSGSKFGNMGCNGGLMDNAFKYAETSAMCTEASYPYKGKQAPTCGVASCNGTVKVTGYQDVPSGDEAALAAAVSRGPVSVAIEADQSAFQFYKSGVFPSTSCGNQLDHGVLVVGYGTLDADKYWIVKNSWGATWGMDGFILLEKDVSGQADGTCGLATQPSQPTTM